MRTDVRFDFRDQVGCGKSGAHDDVRFPISDMDDRKKKPAILAGFFFSGDLKKEPGHPCRRIRPWDPCVPGTLEYERSVPQRPPPARRERRGEISSMNPSRNDPCAALPCAGGCTQAACQDWQCRCVQGIKGLARITPRRLGHCAKGTLPTVHFAK